jgi:hypothetical protein
MSAAALCTAMSVPLLVSDDRQRHPKLLDQVPPRGPPYWKSRVLRRQALDDEDDAQGRWVPQTA